MLRVNRWAAITTAIIIIWALFTAFPLVLSKDAREAYHTAMPSWFPTNTVKLGLDLQGGAHLLLEADMDSAMNDRLASNLDALRSDLRDKKIRYQQLRVDKADKAITFRLRDPDGDEKATKQIIYALGDGVEYSVDNGVYKVFMTDQATKALARQVIEQSIEIIRRRVDSTGTNEPVIQAQGNNRVLVQLPGVSDPSRMKEILGTTAKMSFHLLDDSATSLTLPFLNEPDQKLSLTRTPLLTGEHLTDAAATYDQTGPAVSFRFDAIGSRKFCEISTENTGRPFAIVLDNEIISAPNIREPICGGSGVINGGFTVSEANDLAILLRAGALPAPLEIIEERTIGPSLGSDSIVSGVKAGYVAMVLIVLFLIPTYLYFGVLSSIALAINVMMIFALTIMFGATLTLPGIAGIILTIGMAVDANVLIFERIREEVQLGKSVKAAIDVGFQRAKSAIFDANITTLVAALIMFSLGSGPIKGFAVTLSFGIITTIFSASFITKYLIILYIKKFNPKKLDL